MEATLATAELDAPVLPENPPPPVLWEPVVSQYDDGAAHVVVFELPGVPAHSLCICQEDGSVTVSGLYPWKARLTMPDEGYARFSTRVQLPGDVKSKAGETTLWRDLLILRLPK